MKLQSKSALFSILSLLMFVVTVTVGQTSSANQPQSTDARSRNSETELKQTLVLAQSKQKNVLLVFGSAWCAWCDRLRFLFNQNTTIKRSLENFIILHVDIGSFNKNQSLVNRYRIDLKTNGIPYFVLLDGNGSVLARQSTTELEEKGEYSVEALDRLLNGWIIKPESKIQRNNK